MKLSRVWIRDYRSIKDETIFLSPQCRILVGVNEAGKSNILKALRLIDPSQKSTPADARNVLEEENYVSKPSVHFVFSLTQEDHDELHAHFFLKMLARDLDQPLFARDKATGTLQDFIERHQTALIWENVQSHE